MATPNALHQMLGVQTEAEAITIVTSFNAFLADARAATGTGSSEDALRAVQANASFCRQIATLTGKSGDEAVGILMAWKGSHEQVATLQAKVTELDKVSEGHELDKALAEATNAKKLTPAEEKTYREQVLSGDLSVKTLKALLATKAVNATLAGAAGGSGSGAPPVEGNGGGAPAKGYEHLTGLQRAQLEQDDPDGFAALRADWLKRGEPQAPAA